MANEKMTSKIAQVTIRVTGVWEDEDGNPYVYEKEFIQQIDTSGITTLIEFYELAFDVANFKHPAVCSSLMHKN